MACSAPGRRRSAAGTTRFAGLESSVTGYVQRYLLTDVRDPAIMRTSDPFADDFLVRRDALSYGVEVLVRRAASERLHGWLSYTLSNSQRALGGGVIGPSDWDQRHVVNLVLGYRWHNTTFGGRAHFNTRPPRARDLCGGRDVHAPTGVLSARSALRPALRLRQVHPRRLHRARQRDAQPASDRPHPVVARACLPTRTAFGSYCRRSACTASSDFDL